MTKEVSKNQPPLPIFDRIIEGMTREQIARISVRATEKGISAEQARDEIRREDLEEDQADRASNHAP